MTLTIYNAEDIPQGSDEWLEARRGIITASTVGQLITAKTIKPAQNDTARGLYSTLITERITGHVERVFPNRAMERGTLLEDEARRLYSEQLDVEVKEIGFARLDTGKYTIGASPDGLVDAECGVEIKCPTPKTHINTVLSGRIPAYNRAQVQASMLVTGRSWWDFVSYLPGEPLFIIRDRPDKKWRDAIIDAAIMFEEAAAEQIARYRAATHGLPATEWWDPFDEEEEVIYG